MKKFCFSIWTILTIVGNYFRFLQCFWGFYCLGWRVFLFLFSRKTKNKTCLVM